MTHSINFNVPYSSDELFIVPQPRFKFLDEVAVCMFEDPSLDLGSWPTGIIVVMRLELQYWSKKQTLATPPFWRYQIKEMNIERDSYTEYWYDETELVPLSSLSEEIELEIELALEALEDTVIEAIKD